MRGNDEKDKDAIPPVIAHGNGNLVQATGHQQEQQVDKVGQIPCIG